MITDQKSNSKILGVYVIGGITGIQLGVSIKPNWFRRFCTWAFLGWSWIPIEKLKIEQEKQKILLKG